MGTSIIKSLHTLSTNGRACGWGLLLVTMLTACSTDGHKEKGTVTAKAQSAPYELLIVADKDWMKTTAGEALMEAVSPAIQGLPQEETNFKVTTVAPVSFNGTFKTYSKIVKVDINKKYAEPTYEVATNVYCRPQYVVTFKAANDAALTGFLASIGSKVVDMLNEQEFERERNLLKKHYSGTVMKAANEMFGISINAPQDIDNVKRGKDFLWASSTKQENRLNVCIYTLPLTGGEGLDFAAARDSVMKINIPGEREDQWMETDYRTLTLSQRDQTLVVRGLWDMRNDAMGGPFVSYAIADTTNQRWLIAEGFVFAPEEKKRPLIRELEAMLQTIK